MSASELPLPGLDADAIVRLAGPWTDDGLWEDIQILVAAFWAADRVDEQHLRWHHLVLSVGNLSMAK